MAISPHSNIFLVGLMGAGKSSVGRLLAKQLGYKFIDTDHVIEQRTGASIPLIFDIEGEEGFRQREEQAIEELTQMHPIVLATGGGAVLRETNRKHLRENGTVIYLSATVDQLFERTRRDRNRPLLQTEDPRGKIEQLLATRDPLYREIANVTIETDNHSVRHVVNEILAALDLQKA